MIKLGASIYTKTEEPAFILALKSHNFNIVKMIGQMYTPLCILNTEYPLILYAIESKSLDIVEYIVAQGLSINVNLGKSMKDSMDYAIEINSNEIMKFLVQHDLNIRRTKFHPDPFYDIFKNFNKT